MGDISDMSVKNEIDPKSIPPPASALPAAGVATAAAPWITFTNLKFSVALKGGGRLDILKGISGSCHPGRLLAIMGSSGAGKTTLLDILACNPMGGRVEGAVLVDGAPRRAAAFQRGAAYVLQREVLLASATVREVVTTCALLKLPRALSRRQKEARVEGVLSELSLLECQDTLIGDELAGIKGISGGQRRRVSIGIELIKDPKAIFLDEPTSGLDSEMAVSLVETLRTLASLGRTVVFTIHQPNSLITSRFDEFMLLAAGRLVYGGPWAGAVPAFAAAGHRCPQFVNPTDFFLSVVTQDVDAVEALAEGQRGRERSALPPPPPAEGDIEAGKEAGGAAAPEPPAEAAAAASTAGVAVAVAVAVAAPEVPLWYQCGVLARRDIRSYLRNPLMLFAETAQYLFMGAFVGLMYLRVNRSVATGVPDRLASIWFAMAVLSFTPSYTAATVWDRERVLLRRETGQSMYTVGAWFLARTCIVVPMQLLQTLLFGMLAYWMVGYVARPAELGVYLASYFLFQVTSESIGVLCAAATRTSTTAVLLLTFVLLILLSFSGFLVSDIPPYFKWVRTVSFLTYAYAAVVTSQFDATDFVCTTGPPACPELGLVIPGSQLIPAQVVTGLSVGGNLAVLLGIAAGARLAAFGSVWTAHRLKFL